MATGDSGPPGTDLDQTRDQVLDGPGADIAVLNCLYGVQPIHNEDWAVAMTVALNDRQSSTWFAAEPARVAEPM